MNNIDQTRMLEGAARVYPLGNLMTRVFLDDLRPAPEGWLRTKTARETIDMLAAGGVAVLSLDHDLGDERVVGSGYDVLLWIEEQVALNGFEPPEMIVHSANVAARLRMTAAIESIKRLTAGR